MCQLRRAHVLLGKKCLR
uniref:Uncharacterized protein n=1 Tax=Anguilla anguilla TaxID=7936 RepID=A0A0E9SM36_ANGAN